MATACVLGYVWGSPVDQLLAALQDIATQANVKVDAGRGMRFDLILLSDLIFNHSQVRHHLPHHNHLSPTFRHSE